MLSSLKDFFVLLLPFFIGIAFIYKLWNFTSKKNLPPSPRRLPIIGNLHQLSKFPQRSLRTLSEKYGPVMLLHFGSKPVLVISSAEAAKEVMKINDVSFADRPKWYAAGRVLYEFKDMTFSPYGEYWRQARSICVLQLLSNKRVQSFKGIREEEIRAMLEKINQASNNSSIINGDEIFSTLTNDIIGRSAFGRKFSEEESGSKLRKVLQDLPPLLGSFNVGDFIPWLSWVNYLNGFEKKLNQVSKDCDQYLEQVIDDTRKRDEENGANNNGGNHGNFVSVLLHLQKEDVKGFPSEKGFLKAIILDMIVGGTDTTHLLLHWVITELLKNKHVMTKLQKEVREIVGRKWEITDEDKEKMKYLHAVIKEALRLHPSLPLLVPRVAREDINLMGYRVAKGTEVIINAWAIARDPSYWDEAEEFKPERFLSNNFDFKGLNFEYIPFGSGRRSCPGSSFAIPIVEHTVAHLMHKFNIELPNGVSAEDFDPTDAVGLVSHDQNPLSFVATPVTIF
uniref:Tabersonine/lochnericine 19-hydroxylase n=1 Tax=Catharanthus roseus TaxID=4058 RepID=T19H_CATRO|nr:RecName: Full=Tabersonine/lochnericine 19-hydroxylase; AltName: Full=Cytochrome P450 71BJ1 [Catharanthus roseus]ADZ48681.1 tabersonine/lochnericine 19-hydroxylase [Catharanthus roseus]